MNVQDQVNSYYRSRGYPEHVIAGIGMNIADESGWDPTIGGDNGMSVGLFQHYDKRNQALRSWASQNGLNPLDGLTQAKFADHELQTSHRGVYDALMNTNTAGEAADVFLRQFEVPAKEHMDRRSAKYLGNTQNSFVSSETLPEITIPSDGALSQGGPSGSMNNMMIPPANPNLPQAPVQQDRSTLGQWTQEKMPWLTQDRGDALLAIGSGLLSGDDWASGIAGASNNLMQVSQNQQERDDRKRERAEDAQIRDFDMRRKAALDSVQGNRDSKKYSLGNVELPDGTIRGDLTMGTDGVVYQGDGTRLDPELAKDIQKVNNSDAYGSKGQAGFNDARKAQAKLMSDQNGLEAIDRIQRYLHEDPTMGVEKIAQSADAIVRTLIGRGLTEEQIDRAVAEGDQQMLIGLTREAIVGPGVMTEPDAVRILMAMGGDLSSWKGNPDTFKERLGIVHQNMQRQYDLEYQQFSNMTENFPKLGYVVPEKYQKPESYLPEGALSESSSNTGRKIPSQTGRASLERPSEYGNSELWEQMNDTERRQIIELYGQ